MTCDMYDRTYLPSRFPLGGLKVFPFTPRSVFLVFAFVRERWGIYRETMAGRQGSRFARITPLQHPGEVPLVCRTPLPPTPLQFMQSFNIFNVKVGLCPCFDPNLSRMVHSLSFFFCRPGGPAPPRPQTADG